MTTDSGQPLTPDLGAPWDGTWLNPPPAARVVDGALVVSAAGGTDLWRETSYGFTRDSGHALLAPLAVGRALEVTVTAELSQLYDQLGLLVRADEASWIKAGLERTDGAVHLSSVATAGRSDWSVSPLGPGDGGPFTLRASRGPDAVTFRVRPAGGRWRLLRLAPFPAGAAAAGPYWCAPERPPGGPDLVATFSHLLWGPADPELHGEPPPPD
jgi:regulation of enolase protein 1 (concanavalin A-like superfamily)